MNSPDNCTSKISYVLNVLNGEPFIRYQLQSIYTYAYQIIVVEGAYKKFAFATNNGRSQDTTLNSIRSFPDPEGKIKLIVNDGLYDDRMEMCNEFMSHVTGDIIWQIDVDEFYHDTTHAYVKTLFNTDPALDVISFNFIDVFGPLRLQSSGLEGSGLQDVKRVHRFSNGDVWINQRPPTLGNTNGLAKPIRKKIGGDEMEQDGHLMYNLTMLFEKQIQDKFLYYQAKEFTGPMAEWYENSIKTFRCRFNMLNFSGQLTYLEEITVPLPEICLKMLQDCIGEGSKFKFIDDERHYQVVTGDKYNSVLPVAYSINTLHIRTYSLLGLSQELLRLLLKIFSKSDAVSQPLLCKVLLIKAGISYKKIFGSWCRTLKSLVNRKCK